MVAVPWKNIFSGCAPPVRVAFEEITHQDSDKK